MRHFISHNGNRIKYCIYRLDDNHRKCTLIAMTLDLKRVELLIGLKINVNLEEEIKKVGDKYIIGNYLIAAESFKYL